MQLADMIAAARPYVHAVMSKPGALFRGAAGRAALGPTDMFTPGASRLPTPQAQGVADRALSTMPAGNTPNQYVGNAFDTMKSFPGNPAQFAGQSAPMAAFAKAMADKLNPSPAPAPGPATSPAPDTRPLDQLMIDKYAAMIPGQRA